MPWGSGREKKNQSASQATRKPSRMLRWPGPPPPRKAERACIGSVPQLVLRTTYSFPSAGPFGSTDRAGEWTTVGVHGNVVEASWLALVDALAFAALRQDAPVTVA